MSKYFIKGLIILFLLNACPAMGAGIKQDNAKEDNAYAGEFFGQKVPLGNYMFVKSAVLLFGGKAGRKPQTPQEIEDTVWEQLLLSFVAFAKNITVPDDEVNAEIQKTLAGEKVNFDWKKDKPAYEKWVKQKTGEPTALFENQIKHFLQIEKLRNNVLESIKPEVYDKEAYQRFLQEHNSLSLELVKFDLEKDADEFYKKACGNPVFWEKEKKKRPNDFKRPGFVSLAFLFDFWKIPVDSLNKMMNRDIGEVYPPRAIYKGFGVFKILDKKEADASEFAQAKDPYYQKIIIAKKYEGLNNWMKALKEQAKIKTYIKEGGKGK